MFLCVLHLLLTVVACFIFVFALFWLCFLFFFVRIAAIINMLFATETLKNIYITSGTTFSFCFKCKMYLLQPTSILSHGFALHKENTQAITGYFKRRIKILTLPIYNAKLKEATAHSHL